MSKPALPQGTRDFGPETVHKRNFIFNTIRSVIEVYGYEPLETPALENLETLLGKYGEEGDKLIFKILNNGLDLASKRDSARAAFENILSGKNDKTITERALRYDLTIPFARYVAMNHGQLSFPFKRYQIQPVWRADRPQKGRYREFYQCDADVVGSSSLLNEVELAAIYSTVFNRLGLGVDIKVNNRKILAALAEICGGADKMTDITVAIDKLDKIGLEKVKEELAQRELTPSQIVTIEKYLSLDGSNRDKLDQLKVLFAGNDTGLKGIGELEYLLDYSQAQGLHTADQAPGSRPDTAITSSLTIDFTLARAAAHPAGASPRESAATPPWRAKPVIPIPPRCVVPAFRSSTPLPAAAGMLLGEWR